MTPKTQTQKTINNKEKIGIPIILSSLFIVIYGLVFLYSFNQDNVITSIGIWGVFSISSYYIGAYFDEKYRHYLAAFFDTISMAHSYFIVCYLFNVESYFFVNLLFLFVSFMRTITINKSSHFPQFAFLLVYSFNHFIINTQTHIPLSELVMFNGLFFFFSISSAYAMKITGQVNKGTLGNFNLLLSIYFVIIASVITIEYFNGEVPNKSIFVFSAMGYLFYSVFKSRAFLATSCIGALTIIVGAVFNIDSKTLSNLKFDFDFKLFEEVTPTVIDTVPATEKVIEEPFGLSDIPPVFYVTPLVIILSIFVISKVLGVLKKRKEEKLKEEELEAALAKQKTEEKLKEIQERELALAKQKAEEIIKEPVEVTGYYDPIRDKDILEKAKLAAEERRRQKEEEEFLNPFGSLDDKDDDDEFLL